MKALWLENNQLQLRENLPIPPVPSGEALVRVLRAGICNTDLELLKGYYPYNGILGHEFVGIVEQGPENLINRRVVGEINASCGHCRFCTNGTPTHCENRTVLGIVNRNGAFAEYLTLPSQNLHPIPDNIDNDTATFTEPVAAALEIQEQIKISPNQRVLVVGDGKLGLLVAQTLALTGCELLAVGRHPEKLDILKTCGIQTGFASDITDRSFDIAIECTGNPEGFAIARRALRSRGILILKSTYAGHITLDISSLVVDEITLIGSRCGPFPQALELLSQNELNIKSLIHAHYPLEKALTAFEHAQKRGTLKILLEINQ